MDDRPALAPEDIGAALDRMADLQAGWNGYDAEPPSRLSREAMAFLLDLLAENGQRPRRVAPSAIGGVGATFGFGTSDRKVYLEVYNDGQAYALFSDGKSEPESIRVNGMHASGPTGLADRIWKYLHPPTRD